MSTAPKMSQFEDPFAQALQRALRTKKNAAAAQAADAATQGDSEPAVTLPAPVGQGDYIVGETDCLSTIAAETGHLWQTIWDEPANTDVREVRQDPNVLAAGDRLTIPPLREKTEPGETEMRHRFVRIGQPTVFRLRLADNGVPLAHQPFQLKFDRGEPFSNATNSEGYMEAPVPPQARRGTLEIGTGEEVRTYELSFGALEPLTHLAGIQQRLRNLGLFAGAIDGALSKRLTRGIKAFQRQQKLPVTGQPDAATLARLEKEHGS